MSEWTSVACYEIKRSVLALTNSFPAVDNLYEDGSCLLDQDSIKR